jgi:hypothetical protein
MPIRLIAARLSRASGRALPALAALTVIVAAPSAARAQHHGHAHGGSDAPAATAARRAEHPAPRQGITAAGVLADSAVKESAREAYRAARSVPQVLDGIYCHCDCHERHPELHSLLDCFKSQMAARCGICQGAAKLAARLHGEGKTLEEIRDAVDDKYAS